MTDGRLRTERASPARNGAPAAGEPAIGSLWSGRFRVQGTTQGGFAFVAAVRDEPSGAWFAVKIPKAPDFDLAAFRSEVSFWLGLAPHAHIVRAFEVREIEGRPALFLEYVGGHAFNTVRALLRGGAPLERGQALGFARQIALALEFAGTGGEIAHLDLKPENLMVTRQGTLKVTDFGLARRVQVVDGRYPMVSDGTWPYAAPEWFAGKAVDSRADIYAWGVIVYEMLTGRLPFDLDRGADLYPQMNAFHHGTGLDDLASELYWKGRPGLDDRPLRELVSTCLQVYPGERPASFRELRRELDRIVHATADAGSEPALTLDEELSRAASLCRVGEIGQARTLLNRLLVRHPQDPPLWLRIADLLEAAGDADTAVAIRERI